MLIPGGRHRQSTGCQLIGWGRALTVVEGNRAVSNLGQVIAVAKRDIAAAAGISPEAVKITFDL